MMVVARRCPRGSGVSSASRTSVTTASACDGSNGSNGSIERLYRTALSNGSTAQRLERLYRMARTALSNGSNGSIERLELLSNGSSRRALVESRRLRGNAASSDAASSYVASRVTPPRATPPRPGVTWSDTSRSRLVAPRQRTRDDMRDVTRQPSDKREKNVEPRGGGWGYARVHAPRCFLGPAAIRPTFRSRQGRPPGSLFGALLS